MLPADFRDDPQLAALLDYWERKRGARAMPRRTDIDPLDMPTRLLPFLELIELGEGGRLRYRLIGTAIVDAMGRDATGRYLDQVLTGGHQRFLERLHRTVLRAGRPVYGLYWLSRGDSSDLPARRIAAPLSENGIDVAMILSATRFGVGSPGRGATPPLAARDIEDGMIEVL